MRGSGPEVTDDLGLPVGYDPHQPPQRVAPARQPRRRRGLVDHDGLRHSAGIVAAVERQIRARISGPVAEMRVAPDQPAGKRLGVRVDEQLVGVETKAALGLVGPMHPVAVELARRDRIAGQCDIHDGLVVRITFRICRRRGQISR